ncbi:hypothetical protein [Ancylobacter lacus]|uniref:hypothetical protein n=1 Tax=Ancylobacter lacus TaxID=2579970 RepID=UPI001BCC5490|nr:hypothetical protein [Ancylobacter lacus]MBS7539524.1 hypothetical protein [Ancylobacter lacus]
MNEQAAIMDEPETGTITFIESHRPALADGLYQIEVAQSVRNTNANAPAGAAFDETYRFTRRFQVAGERFAVKPSEIESCFPPLASQGEYANVLPHIVFNRQTLPWERTVGDAARSSWLALLVFDENDPPPKVVEAMVGDLTPAPFPHADNAAPAPSSLPATAVSYPGLTLAFGEVPWDPCRVIDVPVALFAALAPGAVDMPWLSHSRTISSAAPLRFAGLADDQTRIETSVVVGNRLPTPDSEVTVHLVSLENMIGYLPAGDDYTPAAITLPDGQPAQSVRLVTLASWSYRSVDPEDTFSGLLLKLDQTDGLRVLAIKDDAASASDADAYVANALALGYTPVDHHTRQGCRTVSWYRGPFVPFEVPTTIFVPVPDGTDDTPPILTADEIVAYDPETGMMDVSYAAAWRIGQLLALQDKGFSEALVRWKRQNTRNAFEAFERRALDSAFASTLGMRLTGTARSIGLDLQHAAASFVLTRLRRHLVPTPPAGPGSVQEGGE